MSNSDPPERDVKDFEFIQLCKFRVTSPDQQIPVQRGKLVACCSQYGLVIYATKHGFSVMKTADLLAIDEAKGAQRSKAIVEDVPIQVNIAMSSPVMYLDVSGDGLFLAVVVRDMSQLVILFYDVRSFADKGAHPTPFGRSLVNASSSAVVSDLSWNPAVFTLLAVCTSDGNVELIDVTDTPKVIAVLVAAAGATCFCWSPKGKQLLVGRKDGSLAQYDHNLAEKKAWPCPNILTSGSHTVVDVIWQSTYVFLAAYLPTKAEPTDQPVVVMTSSNKDNKTTYINFEDVCFGNGEDRKPQYFFHFVQKWDVILMASSNATETTIVGRNLDDQCSWEHWNLEDCSRAQLPLTAADQNDSFPKGLAVDYSPHKAIVLSESKNLPPCPVMYILSTDGMLLGYYLWYSHKSAGQVTTPPQVLTSAGARKGVPEFAATSPVSGAGLPPAPQPPQATTSQSAAPQPPQATASHSAAPQPPQAVAPHPSQVIAPQPSQTAVPHPHTTAAVSAVTTSAPSASAVRTSPATLSAVLPQTSTAKTAFSGPAPGFSFHPSQPSISQHPFSGFSVPSSTAATTSSLFGGQGLKQGMPASGTANQKQQIPSTSAFSLSGSSQFSFEQSSLGAPNFSFGAASAAPASSAFANLGSSSSAPQAPGKAFSQTLPSLSLGSAHGQPLFTAPTTAASTIFSQVPVCVPAKEEGPKPGTLLTSLGAHPTGSSEAGQPQAPAASAFTSRPSVTNQNQRSQAPGNGLVLSSPVSQSVQAGPAKPVVPISTQSSNTPVTAPSLKNVSPAGKSIEATVDSVFTQNILEEIADFEQELSELRTRSRREVKLVGTREEMLSLRQDRERMIKFTTEISRVTKEQLREVQEQKGLCFDLLATAEECKTKHKRQSDPHYHSLLMGRVLDPASADRLRSLQQTAQTLEQSLLEVDHVLDDKWQEYRASKKKEERFYTPAGETIYKSIKNNHKVISTQRQQLDKMEEQLKNLRLYHNLSGGDFNSLSLLSGDKLLPVKGVTQRDADRVSSVASGMTPEKVAKLREVLSQRKVPRVKSTAPANLSMSRIVHVAPVKSPGALFAAQPVLAQQTPHRPLQQRKHQLTHHVQLLSSTQNNQHVTGQLQSGIQQQQTNFIQQVSSQVKPGPALGGGQRPVTIASTSFSGVAYFKEQQAEASSAAKGGNLTASPATASKVGVGLLPGVTGVKTPLSSALAANQSNLPSQDHVTTLTLQKNTIMAHPAAAQAMGLRANLYEDVTPTETEEDEDYDEEDNGYEDEEEEEEDEEETGFEGILQRNAGQPLKPSSQAAMATNLTQLLNQQVPKSSAPTKTSAAVSTMAGSMKLTTATTTTTKDLFGAKASTGFTFGGPALFGDKPSSSLQKTASGAGQVFGWQANPSKILGFGDLTSRSSAPGGKPELVGEHLPAAEPSQHHDFAKTGGGNGFTVSSSKFGTNSSAIPKMFSFGSTETAAAEASPGSVPISTESHGSGASTEIKPVFGQKADLKFGFPAGGTAAQSAQQAPGGAGHPLAAPSKSLGFQDVASKPAAHVGKDDLDEETPPLAAASSVVKTNSPSSPVTRTSASPSPAPVSDSASAFSFSQAAGRPSSPISGENKPASGSIFGGGATSSAVASVFGGRSPSETTRFSFGTTPSSTSSGFSFNMAAAASGSSSALTTAATSVSVPSSSLSSEKAVSKVGSTESVTKSGPAVDAPADVPVVKDISATATSPEGTPSLFGGGSATSTSASSLFTGVSSKTVASAIFGETGTVTSAGFGSPAVGGSPVTEEATEKPPVFGGASSATSAPVFGIKTATSASPFGAATSSSPPAFGGSTTSVTFGMGSAATSAFGTGTVSSSLFGGGTSTQSSVFGAGPAVTSPFSGAGTSVFGNTGSGKPAAPFSSTSTSSAPTFGVATSTASSSVFGSAASTTSAAPAVPTAGSLFGSAGGGSSSGAGLFGSGSSSTPVFGSSMATSQSGSLFGQTTASTGLTFGQTAASSEGGSSLFGQNTTFGQQPSSSSSGVAFGFGGLGGKPSEEKAKLNVFGSPQVFGGSNNQTSNLFGGGGSSTFGGTDSSMNFATSTGRFSSGAGGVGTSGFNVTVSQPTTGGFGAPPAFGSSPSFGGTPVFGSKMGGFGSSPPFGGTPAFGSSPAFSSPAGSAPTFGGGSGGGFSGFASAAAPSFGQLAQAASTAPSFGSPTQAQASPFGGGFGAVFGQTTASPGFGGGQAQGFGASSSFGVNPAFSSYRG